MSGMEEAEKKVASKQDPSPFRWRPSAFSYVSWNIHPLAQVVIAYNNPDLGGNSL